MKIWIDLANSPQVLFFRPIIPVLEQQGHTVTVTTRYFAQTVELADRFGFTHSPVGGHGGEKISNLGFVLLKRALQLVRFAKGKGFGLAISHNSYAQALGAKFLGIPFITSMDYEHQPANHLCFRLARKVVVPEFFPNDSLKRFGVNGRKLARYKGTKEEIYLADFEPQIDYVESLGISKEKILVVMRPPGTWALYHHFENPLFDKALDHVVKIKDVYIVFLPRIPSQGDAVKELCYTNILVPSRALDGPNLLYHADLVISGGGTMNREAAVLGTPTYSLFKGKLAAVDRHLIDQRRMNHVGSLEQVNSIMVCKKKRIKEALDSKRIVKDIVRLMLNEN